MQRRFPKPADGSPKITFGELGSTYEYGDKKIMASFAQPHSSYEDDLVRLITPNREGPNILVGEFTARESIIVDKTSILSPETNLGSIIERPI